MNKLSKEKRNQVLLTVMGTVLALAVIWLFLMSPQLDSLKRIRKDMTAKQGHLQDMQNAIQKADADTNELRGVTRTLTDAESDMASADPNAWIYDLIRRFKENYKVDISVTGQASIGEVDLVPGIPFRQFRVSVGGTAFYQDLGEFIAGFENRFPHIRIVNLTVEPVGGNGASSEKLSFRMDIIALINPDKS